MRESLKIVRSLRGYLKSVGFISETAQIKDEEEHRNKEFIDLKEHEFLEKKSDFLEKFIEEKIKNKEFIDLKEHEFLEKKSGIVRYIIIHRRKF